MTREVEWYFCTICGQPTTINKDNQINDTMKEGTCYKCNNYSKFIPINYTLCMWTVTNHPSDYPDKFVARLGFLYAGKDKKAHRSFSTEKYFLADTLEELRGKLPQGLTRLQRTEADDPIIVEVWM